MKSIFLLRLGCFALPCTVLVLGSFTLTFYRGELKSVFFLGLGGFALLFAAATLALFGLAFHTGDLMSPQQVLDFQDVVPSLVYLPVGAGVPQYMHYKLTAISRRRPEIMVMGSSRAIAFRREMFAHRPELFYNAAVLASVPETVAFLVDHLPTDFPPRVLLLGVDPNFFGIKAKFPPVERLPFPGELTSVKIMLFSLKRFLRRRVTLKSIFTRTDEKYGWPALGLHAMNKGEGFRGDGSYRFKSLTGDQHPNTRVTLATLPKGALHPNPVRLAAYDRILSWAARYNVLVIGVVTPYAERYYDLVQNSPNHTYYPQARVQLAAMFAAHGFSYYDFADLTAAGWSVAEMCDTFHMTDLLTARLLLKVARLEPSLGAYIDIEQLERDIAQAPSPDTVYDRLPTLTPPEAFQS